MHPTLDSWHPHQDSEGWEQYPYGLGSDLSGNNLGDEAEEDFVQITGTPRQGDATENGEHKVVISAQHWCSDLQVLV